MSSSGAIFVTDQNNKRLVKFADGTSASGQVLVPQAGGQPLGLPQGLAIGPNSELYALDAATGAVAAYDQRGTRLSERGRFPGSHALTVDQAGNLYIGQSGAGVVRKLLPDGRPDAAWGDGSAPGASHVADISGLVATADVLYVSTPTELLSLGSDGHILARNNLIGVGGSLTATVGGTVFMSELRANRVWMFDPGGVLRGRVLGPNGRENVFFQPRGLAVLGYELYVLNEGTVGVYRLGADAA